jgi:hypothetical protein
MMRQMDLLVVIQTSLVARNTSFDEVYMAPSLDCLLAF